MSGNMTLRMLSLSVLFLGLLVVTYAAPINLDETTPKIDENGSQKLGSGTEERFTTDGVKREEEGNQNPIVPHQFHSYRPNRDGNEDIPFTGAAGSSNRIPPWKRGDKDPVPHPTPVSKTDDKIIVDANGNRATGDHLPTPPPMPEHKLKYQVNPMASARTVSENSTDGSNSFSFESSSQKGVGPKPKDIGIEVSRGSYSLTNPDGVVLTVNWVADESGFQPTGADHLPTPPPMPDHVDKMLADLKAGDHLPTPPPMPEHKLIDIRGGGNVQSNYVTSFDDVTFNRQ